jgi:hypothetical protein
MNLLRLTYLSASLLLAFSMPADDTKPSRRAPKSGDAPEASANPPPAPGEARPSQQLRAKVAALPAPPEGVSDLFFDEFFKLPVGPKGLEMTERLTSLDGKRVRILGFMVKHPQATPWTLTLAPMPLAIHEKDFGQAEDLPPATVRVILPRNPSPVTPFTPGLMLLTGRLEVGDHEEADGRRSLVRLHLDPPAAPTPTNAVGAPQISAPDSNRR